MALKTILNKQTDFTGEFPEEWAKGGLWRFNESDPDEDDCLLDSSGMGRAATINNWSGTTASMRIGKKGNYFRFNINNPSTEQTYLKVTNDGSIFASLGARIVCGGWMNPTTYSVGNTYCPIFNTRYGPGQPIFYLSLIRGKPRIMLYNDTGSLILDESVDPPFSLVNGGWYFIACLIEPDNKTAQYVVGDRGTGTVWASEVLSFTGELNRSCTADLILGMHADSYWYAGGLDDWFLDCDTQLTAEDLENYFLSSICANGGDTSGDVDGITEPGTVTLRASSGVYPSEGVLTTAAADCNLSGTGRVSVTSEYISGTTAVSLVEASTSDDLEEWSDWVAVPSDGKLASPNRAYIRFRVTLTTSDTSRTPKVIDIRLYDIPKAPYEKIGYARPVGWMNPTTYSVGNTYCPIFNTRYGPGQPIFYLSLIRGKPRIMLYNDTGSLILDESVDPPFSLVNGGWYFIACLIEPDNKTAQYVVGDRGTGTVWASEVLSFTGELNRSCTADLILGMHADSYWYAGGLDDWFLDCDTQLTAEDLENYFLSSICANGGDTSGDVDGITEPGTVTLRASSGVYPSEGVLTTAAADCNLSGTGRVSVTSEYISGTTAVSLVEASTSDDLEEWSDWVAVPSDGKLASPNRAYIRFRVTLTTSDTSRTPKVIDIRLYDIPKAPYEKIGYARPVVLDSNGAWEAVLENAYDIIVTGEINGEDTLSFKIPYRDGKRGYIDSEKKIQIVDDVYKVRTVTDTRDTDGSAVTEVYAEAEFYDLTFSVRKEERTFEAEYPETAMAYALEGTEWSVGTVTVRTQRTWTSTEKNALSILRNIADLHGGDLVFDCPNRLVHLLTINGKDSGALFAYKKNMKSIQRVVDTRELVTRLYAVGAEGMTFADINGGRPYVEDFTYTSEIRISTLDCSSFTNPYQMKEYAEMRLADYAKPTISYVLNAMDLSVLTGYEHEAWELGDYVRVEDKELGLSVTTRIVRREYNLQEPWNTVLELSTTLKNLGSSASEWDNAADSLEGTSMVSNNDIREMVPFNLLRNSRADDGLAYWVSSGFEADSENGASGTASFKAEGVAGMTKSLSQTVYPANRSSYTLSAQIGSENLEKLSEDSQVGIEVVIEYEDGSTESRFIDLY